MVGPIVCVFPTAMLNDLGSFFVERVIVSTPFVGFAKPSFRLDKYKSNELQERVLRNQPVTLYPQFCDPIEHGNWSNGMHWTVGDGFSFDCMLTTMPVGGKGLEAIRSLRNEVEALHVLLTLLNGGSRVNIDKVEVCLLGAKNPVEIVFPMRVFDILEFGMDHYFRNRLKCIGGLRHIRMEGVKKWVEWHSQFRNKTILDRWLFSKDRLNSISVIEGIGRAMLRDEGRQGDVYFIEAVRKVISSFGLEEIVGTKHVNALNDVNNKLVKHIGDLSQEEDSKYREDAGPLSVLASFLVAYALLRWAIGDLPPAWNEAWRQEIDGVVKDLSPH